ncbi:hypothetical protein JB92DRAFT_3287410 [Gautieria morchelliformis]|nr:hypothetical protein JB92DRAFT_3287410 [Gautieria morchelliformis]
MVATPQTATSSLSTLGEAEHAKLLSLSPHIEDRSSDFLHSRFEHEYVSYVQLNNCANRLATILHTKGVGPTPFSPPPLKASSTMSIVDNNGEPYFFRTTSSMSLSDIFTVLGSSATLCLAPMADLLSDLTLFINSMYVTQIFLTLTVAKLITPDDIPGITIILIGSKPMMPDLVARWAPRCTVINGYGQTGASIFTGAMAQAKPKPKPSQAKC